MSKRLQPNKQAQRGFSLLELLIAMTITLVVMVAASTLLAMSLRTRARENIRSNALGSAQRALNIMSREIGNSGYGLADNGIVVTDSATDSLRVRSNLNNDTDLNDADEDVRFVFQLNNRVIVRHDNATNQSTVLSTNINDARFSYLDVAGVGSTSTAAERIRIEVRVDLPATQEQPASVVRLVSEVALRNAPTTLQRF